MTMSRKKAQDNIVKRIEQISPGTKNSAFYKKILSEMNEKEFHQFISDLKSGKKFLTIQVPNWTKSTPNIDYLLKVGDEMGHNFFQKLWVTDENSGATYLTPTTNMVVDMPIRRASQLLTKKISVPKDHKVVNALTGQPTGDSKGARISKPELEILAAMGAESTSIEFMKYRGGDIRGRAAFNAMLSSQGSVHLSSLEPYASGVESTKTLRTIFNCAHLKVEL